MRRRKGLLLPGDSAIGDKSEGHFVRLELNAFLLSLAKAKNEAGRPRGLRVEQILRNLPQTPHNRPADSAGSGPH